MLTTATLQRLQARHWKRGTLEGINALRSKLHELETRTPEQERIARAFERNRDKIRARKRAENAKNENARKQRIHYSLPVDNDGRETIIATDAFDRRHSFTY